MHPPLYGLQLEALEYASKLQEYWESTDEDFLQGSSFSSTGILPWILMSARFFLLTDLHVRAECRVAYSA